MEDGAASWSMGAKYMKHGKKKIWSWGSNVKVGEKTAHLEKGKEIQYN